MRIRDYRKKPVVIQAVQWDGTAQGATPVIDWILKEGERSAVYDDYSGDAPVIAIKTLEGTMQASKNDYIIKGVQGEFYPCKPDIFEATYDLTDSEKNRDSDMWPEQPREAA